MRQAVWKPTATMADALVAECGEDKERARLFLRLLEDAHEYALLQLKRRALVLS
jgi:hypothetical protein